MTRKLRVTLFGGQGHKALFSKKAAEEIKEKTKSSAIASLLLSRCHAAFLTELESAKAEEEGPAAIEPLEGLHAPEDLIHPPGLQDHPVIHGSTLLLHQLLEHLLGVLPPEAALASELSQPSDEVVGFCSGVLPAIVVSCAGSAEEFLEYSEQAFRLAFWIGYRQVEFCEQEEGEDWLASGTWATALSKRNLDVGWVKRKIAEFNGNGEGPPDADVRLSSTNNTSSVSLVGSPGPLQRFEDFIGDGVSTESLPIHGLYHGGERAVPILEKTLEDVARRHISLPSGADLKRPLRSSASGERLSEGEDEDTDLLATALQNILVDPVAWLSSWEAITQLGSELGAHVEVQARGPVARSLLPLPSPSDVAFEKVAVNMSQQYERDGPDKPRPDDVAIVGMDVNFPVGDNKDAFWLALETGLSSLQEVRISTRRNLADL
jgi:malonyl CoA-acyl carrier protein transacylase